MNNQVYSTFVVKVASFMAFLILQFFALNSHATIITKQLSLDGNQEVGTQGDPDGKAFGSISFNDVTGEISWDIQYFDIADPTAMHIHGPNGGVGKNADILIGLGVNTTGGKGTLIDSLIAEIKDVTLILSHPTEFYVNIHNKEFPAGAIRGQVEVAVPLPATFLLLILGLLSLYSSRMIFRLCYRRSSPQSFSLSKLLGLHRSVASPK
ncbi:CHRD domain-containing protein [Spartinivicinus poritis]|uniref:CHRD domain-containing protein n=1 Tax=Spartinivicinus poritis TaxID=2994640 RepID=A0ABT5UAT1_9GAMM|nr:CHRD domain-containing protein [Spartinivicinus sp. A2-2]MDE1463490.1 CHRD domain-containing protein [Spartinivicinus sp. A2-2]